MATFAAHLTKGLFSARPAATTVPAGSLYAATDTNIVYQSDGATWSTYFSISAGSVVSDTIWDTKGDLAVATGADTASKLAAGANGKSLVADSSQTTGLKWQATANIELKIMDDATVVTTGEGKLIFCIPAALNTYKLTAAQAFVTTVSSSGLPGVGIRSVTGSYEMLTTNITIDASEFTSYTAATAAVIDTASSHDVVATGDLIAVDVDVAGTGAKGLGVILTFTLP